MSPIGSKLPKIFSEGTPTALGWILIGAVATGTILVVALLAIVFTVSVPLPDNAPGGQATEVLDSDGELIGTLKGEQKRQIVPLEEMAPVLQQAVVATEDRRFYEHSGISPRGMVRALFANVQAGGVEQGGSTITQQYARNAYGRVGTERTIARKIREIALARRIEASYSKDKILEFYLNTIYFGRGAYGAEAASLTYFKKSAKDLTLSEAAYMAGAIRSPENIQPDEAPEAVVRARNQVLNDMVATGAITQAEAEAARAEDVLALFQLGPTQLDTARAGFFLQHVRRLLQTPEFGFTDAELLGGGLTIETSLDLRMQDAAEKAVLSVMDQPEDPEVAMIAMDPDGFVRVMIGGRDVGDRVRALGFNYAANVREDDGGGRQAGSALKPVALAAYLQKGENISRRFPAPRSITIDERACRDGEGKPWTVSNFDSAGFGTVDVAQATANSVNTVYAQMMAEVVTPRGFIATSEDLGIEVPARDEGCALTLGTTDVTPLEMARAFTTFAARGHRPETVMIVRVIGPDGRTLIERSPRTQRVLDEDVADTVNQALQEVVTGGTGRGAAIGRPAAGKTGTTQNHLDAWFAGYTPDLTAVVWMGFAPGESGAIPLMTDVRGRRVTGGAFPAAIWKNFMQEALKNTRPTAFAEPKAAIPSPVPLPTCAPDTVPGPDGGCVPIDAPPDPELPDVFVPFEPDPEILPIPTPTRVPPTPRPTRSPTPTPTASPTPTGSPTPTPTPTPSPTPTQAQVGQEN